VTLRASRRAADQAVGGAAMVQSAIWVSSSRFMLGKGAGGVSGHFAVVAVDVVGHLAGAFGYNKAVPQASV